MKKSFSRAEKRLVFGVPIGCLALVGVLGWARGLEAAPPLEMPPVPKRPNPNGYDLYLNAAKNWTTNLPLAEKQFALALQTPTMAPDARPDAGLGFKGVAEFRVLTRAKVAQAKGLLLQNRALEAGICALDAIQMSQDMARGAIFVGKLQGATCAFLSVTPFQTRENLIEKLNATQAQSLATRLEKILDSRVSMAQIFESDRWVNLSALQSEMQKGNWRRVDTDSGGEPLSFAQKWQARTLTQTEAFALVNRSFDQAIADLNQPWSATSAPALELPIFIEPYGAPNAARAKMNESREIMPLRLLLLQLALRSYRAKNGRYPTQLSALSPTILRRVPTDYYADEKPFRFVCDGKKYRLWSRGMDGVDNGGTPIKWPNGTGGRSKSGNLPPLFPGRAGDYVAGENS